MCEFRRTRSKVWWSNYYHEDDETDDIENSTLQRSAVSRFSWRRSLVENSNRNSSSSPSNGSQKSQDSGFSDSESSSPSSCGSKSDPENRQSESCDKCDESKEQSTNSETVLSKLPDTPVRSSRPHLLRHKKREKNVEKTEKKLQLVKSKCDSISSYLADCYFPITNFVNSDDTKTEELELPCPSTSTQKCSLSRSLTYQSLHSDSSADIERTCFIVDELPKKSPTRETNNEKTPLGSTETISSSSSENNTVRFLDKVEPSSEHCSPVPKQEDLPCLNVDSLKNDHNETLDLSLLPDPAHTSTPKKDDIRTRSAKKIRRPSPVVVEENR